jgi:hypothetical protein
MKPNYFSQAKESNATKANDSINQTQQVAGEVNINIEDMKKSFAQQYIFQG